MRRSIYTLACLLTLLLILGAQRGTAQQIPTMISYLFQPALYNPAALGKGHIAALHRYQLLDFDRSVAPITYGINADLSFLLPFSDRVGAGVSLMTDQTHIFRRNNLDLSFAYHLYNYEGHRISLGLVAGVLNQYLDFGKLSEAAQNDMTLYDGSGTAWVFDGGPGLYYSYTGEKDEFSLSLTVPQIFTSDLNFKELEQTFDNRFHILAGARYRTQLEGVAIEPAVLFRGVHGMDGNIAKSSVDVSGRLFFAGDRLWVAAGAGIGRETYFGGLGIDIAERLNLQAIGEYHTSLGPSLEVAITYRFREKLPPPPPPVVKEVPPALRMQFEAEAKKIETAIAGLEAGPRKEMSDHLLEVETARNQANYAGLEPEEIRAKVNEARSYLNEAKNSLNTLLGNAQNGLEAAWVAERLKVEAEEQGYDERSLADIYPPIKENSEKLNTKLREAFATYAGSQKELSDFILRKTVEMPLANIIQNGDLQTLAGRLQAELAALPGVEPGASVRIEDNGDTKLVFTYPYINNSYHLDEWMDSRKIMMDHVASQISKLQNSRLRFRSVNLRMLLQEELEYMEGVNTDYPYIGDFGASVPINLTLINTDTGKRTNETRTITKGQTTSIVDLAALKLHDARLYLRSKGLTAPSVINLEISGPNFDEPETQTMHIELVIDR
ncbi:MAG: PorP/SprF family type IX secretion system membrane protein [Saprospiraceae bacterium]|nr:PorP/SprF family type IX secretion system membrane protein [Lewinella sp.]